jgi:sulfoxide reductase heme-binding subunit YedZ
VDLDAFLWLLARVAGLSSFASLSIALLTGVALRTDVLAWLSHRRAVRSLHEFTVVFWLPLAGLHVSALLLDQTARIGVLDLVVPFRAPYGTVAIGLGTLSFELLALVTITGWLRRHMQPPLWRLAHRTAYAAFGLLFVHSVLGGTDFSDPAVSALTWSVAFALAVLSFARFYWRRLPA